MSESGNSSGWAFRLWDFNKHYQHLGDAGGAGVGYGLPAAVGGALANKKYGRLSVNIQGDGDLLYAPGVLWTAAHHQIPLLTVMHNNRVVSPGGHAPSAHGQPAQPGRRRARTSARRSTIRTSTSPRLRREWVCFAEGPITNPNELGPAIARALAVVKKGEPALVDVVTQPR